MNYTADDIMERLDEVMDEIQKLTVDVVRIKVSLEVFYSGMPNRPCPYPHYPFPSIYQPVPPYITWSMTYPPITGTAGTGIDGMGGFPKQPEGGAK